MTIRIFKYRIYPTAKQKRSLQATLDACRWVYNKSLETRKRCWEEMKLSVSLYDCNKLLTTWRQNNKFLQSSHSQVLQEVNARVDKAFKAFFRRCKRGEKPGYPRFKSFDRYDSFTYPQSGFSLIDGSRLKLSKIGSIKINLPRPIDGKVKTLTIRRSATGKWYVCFSCEIEAKPLNRVEKTVGIDMGLTTFATYSDGTKIQNPRFFKTEQAKLAKSQRRLSATTKGTDRRKKLKKVVARAHERVANKRSDFAHKLSRQIVNDYQAIVFEDLNIQSMLDNHTEVFGNKLNRSIADASWSQFINFTAYKAEEAGRTVVLVNPRNTSQACSRCGQIVKKDLSVRVHECVCGLVIDRDHNAALNILALGTQSLAAQAA